jgi:hypothetical protein
MIGVRLYLPPRIVNAKMHFFGIVQIFDINIIFNEIGVPSEQGSPKNRLVNLLSVTNSSSALNSAHFKNPSSKAISGR